MIAPSTQVVLATVSASSVPPQKDQDKQATLAGQNLVSAIKQLVGAPLSAQKTAQITPPRNLIVTVIIVGSLANAGGVCRMRRRRAQKLSTMENELGHQHPSALTSELISARNRHSHSAYGRRTGECDTMARGILFLGGTACLPK
jgi:hypothetical protein